MKKNNNSNPPFEGKLAYNSNSQKIQKKKSIAKTDVLNQITSNGGEKSQLKKNIEKAKGKCIMDPSINREEQMDVDQVTCHFNCPFKDDIIMEILCRLPVRYLVQFKCVSKLWNALISDPYFVNKHLNHAKNDPHAQKLLLCEISLKDFTTSIYSCPLSSVRLVDKLQKLDPPSSPETITCCTYNGLVVISAFSQTIQQPIHMLWNPSTRESILLPQPEFPRQNFYRLGLGYDSTIGDYKILKIDINNPNEGSKVPGEILTLKSGSWRNIDKFPHGLITWASGFGSALALVNNAFHWICVSGDYYGVSRTFSLVSFGISNEVYSEIPLPEQLSCIKGNIDIGISEVKEMLCAYCTYVPQQQRTFKLWILKNYGVYESWNSLLSIVDHRLVRAIPKYWFADGDVLFWSSYLAAKPRCSFRTTSRGTIGLCDDNIRNGFVFTESLISPKSLI